MGERSIKVQSIRPESEVLCSMWMYQQNLYWVKHVCKPKLIINYTVY